MTPSTWAPESPSAEAARSVGPTAVSVAASQASLPSERPSPVEIRLAWFFLAVMLVLRLVSTFTFPFDSDEPQHLHVAWAWTQGLVQYRDTFDNHTPLFHLAMAPLVALIGERTSILYLMRLAMLPVLVALLATTWGLARQLYSARVALWSVVLLSLFAIFFDRTLEFRTDGAWAALCVLGVYLLLRSPLTPGSLLRGGMALGAALAVSLKTSLLLAALLVAGGVLLWVRRHTITAGAWRRALPGAGAFLAGLAIIPAAVVALFAELHALGPMWRCTIGHNVVPHAASWGVQPRWALLPLGIGLAAAFASRMSRTSTGSGLASRRLFLGLVAFAYLLVLVSAWPLRTSQTYLPDVPLLMVLLTVAVIGLADRWGASHLSARASFAVTTAVLGALAATEVSYLLVKHRPWQNQTRQEAALLQAVLRLTDPADAVMDNKGETVFRRRAFYYVLETITRKRIEQGLLADTIARDVVASGCTVAAPDNRFLPATGRAFLNANFLPVGPLRVAGKLLGPAQGPDAALRFEIAIPAPYVVVSSAGPAPGLLDGVPSRGGRFLDIGPHLFLSSGGEGELAVVWERAVDRGFSPFAERKGVQ